MLLGLFWKLNMDFQNRPSLKDKMWGIRPARHISLWHIAQHPTEERDIQEWGKVVQGQQVHLKRETESLLNPSSTWGQTEANPGLTGLLITLKVHCLD